MGRNEELSDRVGWFGKLTMSGLVALPRAGCYLYPERVVGLTLSGKTGLCTGPVCVHWRDWLTAR